jgi:hypothetical protein
MNKPGDIVMIFASPLKCEQPIDPARLIKKLSETDNLEQWQVEYTNDEGLFYNVLIKKDNGTNKETIP